MRLALIVLVTTLGGCVHNEVLLVNDRGEKRYCYEDHNTSLTSVGAVAEFNKCLNDAGSAGFRRRS